MSQKDEVMVEKIKKFLDFLKKECPGCYEQIGKCCSSDCCAPNSK